MKNLRIAVLTAWILGCLVGMAWLLSEVTPARADEPDVATEAAVQTDKLGGAQLQTYDNFGYSLAVDGDYLIVGAPHTTGTVLPPGSAYIYRRDTSNPNRWNLLKKLVAADGESGDLFGFAVDINGDTAVVGAPRATAAGFPDAGSVYVFARNENGPDQWGQTAKLSADDVSRDDDRLGMSVAIDGNTIAAGAPFADSSVAIDTGAVYVFSYDSGSGWQQSAKLRMSPVYTQDLFGYSVALEGDVLVGGAPWDNIGGILNTGSVQVFHRDSITPTVWHRTTLLTATDRAKDDELGTSVALNGGIVVAGAPTDPDKREDPGAVYIFARTEGGDTWYQSSKLVAPDSQADDLFGFSVASEGAVLLVGAQYADIGTQLNRGAAYTFERDQGGANNWGFVDKLLASDGIGADLFGFAVATNESQYFVGAPYANIGSQFNTGAAYVFVGNVQQVHLPVVSKQ